MECYTFDMATKKNVYSVSRDEAAVQLAVSTRTLDRWLKSGRLKSKADGRTVWVHAEELEKMVEKEQLKAIRRGKKAGTTKAAPRATRTQTSERNSQGGDELVYKKLFEEAASDIKAKQEKLEAAHFRVGQLEAQVQNSVPLLEYKQEKEDLVHTSAVLATELATERMKKWIFVGLSSALGLAAIIFGWVLFG